MAKEYIDALLECYHLGDFLEDSKFKNAVIDALIDRYNTKFNGRRVYLDAFLGHEIMDHIPIRNLIVDMYACVATSAWLKENYNHLPKNFILDLAIELLDQRPGERKLRANSHYHEPVVNT